MSEAHKLGVQNVYGRMLSQQKIYVLPTDKEEHNRLDIQHQVLCAFIGGLYFAQDLVHKALASQADGKPARILDVGTGSGVWAIAMAENFPSCEVVGIDLVLPSLKPELLPPNLKFEAMDINSPLTEYTDGFNFVHARAIDGAIKDYPRWLNEVARILRPGGVYLLLKGGLALIDEDMRPLPTLPCGQPGYSGIQSIFSAIQDVTMKRVGVDTASHWEDWMKGSGYFEQIGRRDTFIPVGPWQESASPEELIGADLMRDNVRSIVISFKPTLLLEGYPEEIVDQWTEDTIRGLKDMQPRCRSPWMSAWCVRTDEKWRPYSS